MAARLKVFLTSDGLTDYVVAVSSRAKALAAWGVRQDLFKEGRAHETDDKALVKAALAQPGAVLRRESGTRSDLAKIKPAKAAKPQGPTKAQRRKVAELETRLQDLEAEHDRSQARLEAQRRDLDAKAADLSARHATDRDRARGQAQRRATGARVRTTGKWSDPSLGPRRTLTVDQAEPA